MQYRPPNAYQEVSNTNHFGFVSDSLGRLTAVSQRLGSTVVPDTASPLGERPPALAGHFCNVPTTLPC